MHFQFILDTIYDPPAISNSRHILCSSPSIIDSACRRSIFTAMFERTFLAVSRHTTTIITDIVPDIASRYGYHNRATAVNMDANTMQISIRRFNRNHMRDAVW